MTVGHEEEQRQAQRPLMPLWGRKDSVRYGLPLHVLLCQLLSGLSGAAVRSVRFQSVRLVKQLTGMVKMVLKWLKMVPEWLKNGSKMVKMV